MIVKVKDKEYPFDGYVNPINSVQKLIVDVYQQGKEDAIDEYSSKLWQVIENCTVDCRFDFNLEDLHNLEIVIKGLAEELKEQKE